MKVIQTHYNGYHFRSRLEARWATFFDTLGIKYEYEPEGFELPSGRYLPDFFLPDILKGTWVEIKSDSDKVDINRTDKLLEELTLATDKPSLLIRGTPMDMYKRGAFETYKEYPIWTGGGGWDNNYIFCICPWCGKVGLEYDGRGARVCGYKTHFASEKEALEATISKSQGLYRVDDKCYSGDHPRILAAAIAARSARFEFGGK